MTTETKKTEWTGDIAAYYEKRRPELPLVKTLTLADGFSEAVAEHIHAGWKVVAVGACQRQFGFWAVLAKTAAADAFYCGGRD